MEQTKEKEILGKVRDASIIRNILPYIETEISDLTNIINHKAYFLIEQGKMTNEIALNLWLEKNAYRKLLSRIKKRITIGQTAGQTAPLDK